MRKSRGGRGKATRAEGLLEVKGRFGFVAIDDGGGGGDDVYVARTDFGGAMDGDRVRIRVETQRDGRFRGEVVEVLARGRAEWIGTVDVRTGAPVILPIGGGDAIRIHPARAIGKARPGDRVVVRITRYPVDRDVAHGEVVEVLGRAGDPRAEVEVAKRRHEVPGGFPAAVLRAAEAVPDRVRPEDLPGRLDLRGAAVFTIDPDDARDFDDAISIEAKSGGGGGWRLGVHIADVAAYVPVDGPIDREAYARGTSTYLVDGVVPMLPERLSNGACSLVEGEDRLTVTAWIDIAPDGAVRRTDFARSVIRSRRRFTYDEVDAALDGRAEGVPQRQDLTVALACARALHARRLERGAIDLEVPEVKPRIGPDGRVAEVVRIPRTWSHRLVEEFMIAANEAVARRLFESKVPVLYRIHEEPSASKWKAFREFVRPLGHRVDGGTEFHPGHLQAILRAVAGRPEESVVSMMMLRSMMKARYAPENLGHFGLASGAYLHFTSPIRRYPDLIAHRHLLRSLEGWRPAKEEADALLERLEEAGEHLSRREREAQEAEYESVEVRLMEYAAARLGETFEGVVSGVTDFGVFVEMHFGLDGLVRLRDLPDDFYQFDERTVSLRGRRTNARISLGNPVVVSIARVDIEARQVDLLLVPAPGARRAT